MGYPKLTESWSLYANKSNSMRSETDNVIGNAYPIINNSKLRLQMNRTCKISKTSSQDGGAENKEK